MKKGGILFIIVGTCLFLLTGCNSKTILKCNKSAENFERYFNLSFTGNKINALNLQYTINLSEYSDNQIDALNSQDLCNELKTEVEDFKESLTDCNQKLEDNKLNILANFDVDKISSDQLSKMQTPEDAKKDLEKSGYSCKIEK